MSSRNARLTFAPDPQFYDDVMTIARLTGQPASGVVRDATSMLGPLFREVAASLLNVEKVQGQAKESSDRFTGEFRRKLEPHIAAMNQAARDTKSAALRLDRVRPVAKAAKRDKVDPRIRAAVEMAPALLGGRIKPFE